MDGDRTSGKMAGCNSAWEKPEEFVQTVRRCLPKYCLKRIDELYLDFKCIQCGIKPSLLFDYGVVDRSVLEEFVSELNGARGSSQDGPSKCMTLSVIAIGGDFLICNPEHFSSYLSHVVQNPDCAVFVNVSSKLDEPRLMCDRSETIVTELSNSLLCAAHNGGCPSMRTVEVSSTVNVTSLFGLSLGYPIIYWYDCLDENQGNCLDMIPLVVNRVSLNVKSKGVSKHFVYSFSYPEKFEDCLKAHVEEWFAQLKSSLHFYGELLQLQTEHCVLPSVAL